MKITDMSTQVNNTDRVNIFVDGKYELSLSVAQVVDSGIRIGTTLERADLVRLKDDSEFGKLYQRALEYCLLRPRSDRELSEYLYKKTLTRPVKSRHTNTIQMRSGVEPSITKRVHQTLVEKGHVNDEVFAEFWIRNRFMKKGISERKLRAELASKGVDRTIVDEIMKDSERSDEKELEKMIVKKRHRYNDDGKLMQYLARQGFRYDDIKAALEQQQN